jgi:hypothetical protein
VVVALTGEELQLISRSSVVSGQVFGRDFTVEVDALPAVKHLVALVASVR